MYHPTTRLLTILELLQSRGEMTGDELAQVLEVEKRSLRRYILMLRDMGIPVEGERGRHGGYALRPGFRLPPMMFNAQEITAIMIGLQLTRELGSVSLTAVESVTAKIERVLPEDLCLASDALRSALIIDNIQPAVYAVTTEQITEITLAAHQEKCLDITYQSSDGMTERRIAPYGLVLHTHAWYVPAYCYQRQAVRVFRLDHIRSITRTEQAFITPKGFDTRQFVLDSLARIPGTYSFEVLFHASLKTVQEVVPPSLAVLESRGNDTLMRCYSDDPHWLARYLLRTDLRFTVLETIELRNALQTLAENIINGLQNGTPI